jgi:hypothetical protein
VGATDHIQKREDQGNTNEAGSTTLITKVQTTNDDDDDELQSEIEAQHASTRIQQREPRGTFRSVNPRQHVQVRINNPESSDNRRSRAYTQ